MDFINDRSGRHLLRINALLDVPDYVKTASVDADGVASLPAHLFVDEAHREFPVDTDGHAYLSQAYCLSAGIKDKFILDGVKQASARFPQVAADIAKLEAKLDESIKSGSTQIQPQFAVYVDFGPGVPDSEIEHVKSGGVRGFYPINDAFEVTESAVKLGNDAHRLPKELFVEGCQALYKAASNFGCKSQLPKTINEYGLERLPDYEFVKQQAEARKSLTGDDVYLELAASAEEDADHSSNQWAELWMQADTQHGVKYAKHTLDPYQIFHSGIPVEAFDRELDKWTLVKGAAVPVAALKAISEDSLNAAMTKSAADAVRAAIAKSAAVSGAVLANELSALDPAVQRALLKLVAQ